MADYNRNVLIIPVIIVVLIIAYIICQKAKRSKMERIAAERQRNKQKKHINFLNKWKKTERNRKAN